MIEEIINKHFGEDKIKDMKLALLILVIIILAFGIVKLYKFNKCSKEGAFLTTEGECFIPRTYEERQQIIEQGYIEYKENSILMVDNFTILVP